MDIEKLDKDSFLAEYPDIDDPEFQQKILDKTEFSILDSENKTIEGDIYFTFQRNIGILLSPVTPYKKMLFFLSVGSGKTCTSILVHELTKEFLNGVKRPTIVVTKGKSLEDNFKNEFIKRCPGIEKNFAKTDEGQIRDTLGLRRELNANFSFKKYGAFSSMLSKASDEWIKNTYSGRTFILDEAQVIKNGGKMYKQFQRLFDLAEDVTIIEMSGTPNTDHPSEGIRLVNLLKPKDERMITGKRFLNKYYTNRKFNKELEEELLNFYNGYVIYLKQTSDIIPTEFVSHDIPKNMFRDFSVYNVRMDPFQAKIYDMAVKKTHVTAKKKKDEKLGINIFERDEEGNLINYESQAGGAFMKLAREAALFCYPDGTFGADGFKKNLSVEGSKIKFTNVATQTEILKNINKYSAAFAASFDLIKSEPTRVFYIYFDNVNNSGLLLYAKLLELKLGFEKTDARLTLPSKKPKYIKIDGSVTTPISQILKKVGDRSNADGSLIRVILGSPISGVGLTLSNATRVIVFDSQFTPYDITQIINRINRPGSLDHLKEAGLPTDCKAYLYTSSTIDNKSIDLDIYKIAQEKIDLINPQIELMARSDPFCAVSAKRNGIKDCFTASPTKRGRFKRVDDISTDVLYWRSDEIDALVADILAKVVNHPVLITDYFSEYDPMIVYRAVKKIISNKKILGDKIIFISGDLIFIDDTLYGDINATWFVQKMIFPNDIVLEDLITREEYENDESKIMKLSDNISTFKTLSKYTQILLYEYAWTEKTSLNKKIKKLLPSYEVDGRYVHILSAEPITPHVSANSNAIVIEDPTKIREFVNGQWQYFRGDVQDLVSKIKEIAKNQIKKIETEVDDKYGIYGKYDKHNNFQIVVIGKGSGKRCNFFKLDEQKEFFNLLDESVPKDFDKMDVSQRCQALEKICGDKNLIK